MCQLLCVGDELGAPQGHATTHASKKGSEKGVLGFRDSLCRRFSEGFLQRVLSLLLQGFWDSVGINRRFVFGVFPCFFAAKQVSKLRKDRKAKGGGYIHA